MKKNSKKFLAFFLAFGVAIQPVSYIQAQEAVTEVVTEAPVAKESTAQTEAPKETAVQTEESTQTEAPVQTETVAQTETSVQTEIVAQTETWVQTEKAKETETETAAQTEKEEQKETVEKKENCVTTPETEPEFLDKAELKNARSISKETPDTESVTEADTDGATYAVNNSTTLANGVYKPDQFTVTGGSSKTSFSCTKITVSEGKASATIEIGSANYTYVKANGQKYSTVIGSGKVTATFPVQLNTENKIIAYTTAMKGKEITYMITVSIDEENAAATIEKPDDLSASEKDNSAFTSKVDNSTTFKDAVYKPDAFSYSGGTSKTSFECSKVTVTGGKAFATIVIKSAKYDYVKANGCKYVTTQNTSAGTATVVIPVKLNAENVIIAHTTAMGGKEISYTLNITMDEEQQEDTSETETETGTETETETETETTTNTDKNPGEVKKDGEYSIDVTSNAEMFRVIQAVLTLKNGVYIAKITLSGTGYDLLFMGTAAAAAKADGAARIGYTLNADGKYVFTIPISALDQAIPVAAHSLKKNEWYDRTLTFHSATMKWLGSDQTENGTEKETEKSTEKATEKETEKPNKKPDKESAYEDDLSGATSAVNSSTSLADGVYTPDKFSWSGGSGKVSISCNKITVSGGQAYATLVFSSSSYSYVKANGRKYTGSTGGGTSSFTIPVQLNANNTVIGMTTAMSVAHEITYNVYIYLAAADKAAASGDKNNGNEEAPQIVGLTYQSETKLENAKLLHIYHYEDGITLIEIDLTTDLEWDTKKETADEVMEELSAEEASEEETEIQTKEEITAELYKADTLKYLIVPNDVEIPVGMEKEMIVVQIPAKSIYVSANETLETLDALNQMDAVKTTGVTEEECSVESVKEALQREEVKYAGDFWNLEFKTLLLSGCDLALFASDILPKEETDAEAFTERYDAVTSGFATLGVPMIIDRSQDEATEEAKAEWKKVYEIIFGCGETNEK